MYMYKFRKFLHRFSPARRRARKQLFAELDAYIAEHYVPEQ